MAPVAVAPRRDRTAPSPEFSPAAETVSPVPRVRVKRSPTRSPLSELPGTPRVFRVMVRAPAAGRRPETGGLRLEAEPHRTVSAPAPEFSPEAPIASREAVHRRPGVSLGPRSSVRVRQPARNAELEKVTTGPVATSPFFMPR